MEKRKTIVISAVNLNIGGTLTILSDCLHYLSELSITEDKYRIIALVFRKEPVTFPGIEYIEMQWPKKCWINRLWCEYISMKRISIRLQPIDLWLSLHDTSPNVRAVRQAVYCHNPFPFYKWKAREFLFSPKIVLFALFSKYIYRINIGRNYNVIVQQQWIRNEFIRMFGLEKGKIIVATPSYPKIRSEEIQKNLTPPNYTFLFAASPNSHKNFECICRAVEILQQRNKLLPVKVFITVKGNENAYARWLYKKWGKLPNLNFTGFVDKETLFRYYTETDCLIFPSKVETWGLPISEFAAFRKPMLLADLPYAHETASGLEKIAFFDPGNPEELAAKMKKLAEGNGEDLKVVKKKEILPPHASSWKEMFNILLK